MKYKAIYDVLERSDTRITYENSGWRAARPTIVDSFRPLWIVAETPKLGLRLWICHECGQLSVTTANMNLKPDSREYHESQTHRTFRRQSEFVIYLRELLLPQVGGAGKCAS